MVKHHGKKHGKASKTHAKPTKKEKGKKGGKKMGGWGKVPETKVEGKILKIYNVCMKEKKVRRIRKPRVHKMSNGRLMIKGTCADGHKMIKLPNRAEWKILAKHLKLPKDRKAAKNYLAKMKKAAK
jgi:hypothetical protein